MRTTGIKRLVAMTMAVCVLAGMMPQNVRAEEAAAQTETAVSEETSSQETQSEEIQPEETMTPETQESVTSVSGNEPAVEPSPEPSSTPAATEEPMAGMFRMPNIVRSGDQTPVSRIQWLKELTTTFDMTVEKDNYPDNYYSDIDSSYADYYTVMLATEFGLVDVEAGEAFEPEKSVTREYAAYTMNHCLGYAAEADYTFDEEESTSYSNDIKVAIKRGWFGLEGTAFHPEWPITDEEKNVMLSDAEMAMKATTIDTSYQGTYRFKDNIIELPTTVVAVMTAENQLTLSNCDTTIKQGDLFGIVSDGFPIAYKAIDVKQTADEFVVDTERIDTQDAFENIDVQGEMNVDLSEIKPYDSNMGVKYIVGGTEEDQFEDGIKYDNAETIDEQEISAVEISQDYHIPEAVRQKYHLSQDIQASITCKISNLTPKYRATERGIYVDVNAKIIFSCNVGMDVLKDLGITPSYELVYIPIGYLGYMKVTLDLALEGKITFCTSINMSTGLYYEYGEGFRLVSNFDKKEFTLQANGNATVGLKFQIGLQCGILEASISGKVGGKAEADHISYADEELPAECEHIGAWLYVSVSARAEVDLFLISAEWTKNKDVYNEDNSPVRVYYHYEDGKPVDHCTRDQDSTGSVAAQWKYYTPADSRYGYNGSNSGIDSNGNKYNLFNYYVNSDGNAVITKYQGNMSALSIPDTIDGYSVVEIEDRAFEAKAALRVIQIPDSVTVIGAYAFADCSNLVNVTLPQNLETMNRGAFNNCTSLESIEIPPNIQYTSISGDTYNCGIFNGCTHLKNVTFEEGTTKIVKYFLANCQGLESVTIPDTVVEIEDAAFDNCENLEHVYLGKNITSIGKYAFYFCKKLTDIELPSNLKSIGHSAFGYCDSLKSIVIPKNLEETIGNYGVFYNCANLQAAAFEEGTTKIVSNVFVNCKGLINVTIPETVTVIGDSAFRNCSNLEQIEIPNSVDTIQRCAFSGCVKLKNVVLPSNLRIAGYDIFSGCNEIESINIPKSLKSAGNMLDGCNGLTTVIFEEDITCIIPSLFANCLGLKQIVIPDTVTEIRDYAFENCSNLIDLKLSNNLEHIGRGAFQNCSALEKIELPKSLKETDCLWTTGVSMPGIFEGCNNLKEVTFEEGTTCITARVFENCLGIENIVIPEGVTEIQYGAFKNCEKLSSIQIPKSVTDIGKEAFYNCPLLDMIELPENIERLGQRAFYGCNNLKSILIPKSLSEITENTYGYGPFEKCINLETIIFEEGTPQILEQICFKCIGLKNIEIPDTVLEIQPYAFYGCSNLEKVDLLEGICKIERKAFGESNSLTSITLPRSITYIDPETFSNANNLTIYGMANSYAQSYAAKIGAVFVATEIKATEVSLNKKNVTILSGQNESLVLTVLPADYTDKIIWSSSDINVAKVNEKGVITGVSSGSAIISVDVGEEKAICKVIVLQAVESIDLSEAVLNLIRGEEHRLIATVKPTESYNKELVWKSSNEKIVVVDRLGVITAKGKGQATITVTSTDGSNISSICLVNVVEDTPPTPTPTQPVEEKFTDVQQGAWYVSAVQYAYDNGIMGGKSETVFAPEANLTRAEFATVLYSQSGKPAVTYRPVFKDVEKGAWYSSPVLWAYDNGIVSGYANGNFGTSDNITREQLALMMYKYAKTKGYDTTAESGMLQKFSDEAQISTWAREAIQWAASHGIMSGKGNGADGKPLLDPQGNATRAECAAMMKKMLTMN